MPEKTALEKPQSIFSMLDSADFKGKLAKALPETLKVERVVQLAYTLLRKNPTLAKCSPLSILASIADSSALGFEIDDVLGLAYLVPFKSECKLIVGYRGFAELMYRTGLVSSISTEIVRDTDRFSFSLGTKRQLLHVPAGTPAKDGPANWRGAYAAVQFITGMSDFEYLDKAHIESARNRSNGWRAFERGDAKDNPWHTDPEEMWKKTPIRRMAKRMPRSVVDKRGDLMRAAMLDEYGEKPGLLVPTDTGWQINPEPELPAAEPIAPTLEAQLQESIEDVKRRQENVAKKNKLPKGKGKMVVSKEILGPPVEEEFLPPKAKIPAKIDDPYITLKQQTDLYNSAAQAGWTLDEFIEYVKKNYKSIREVRQSQYAALLAKAKGNAR